MRAGGIDDLILGVVTQVFQDILQPKPDRFSVRYRMGTCDSQFGGLWGQIDESPGTGDRKLHDPNDDSNSVGRYSQPNARDSWPRQLRSLVGPGCQDHGVRVEVVETLDVMGRISCKRKNKPGSER